MKRLLKILGKIFIAILVLLAIAVLAIQTTPVQNFIVGKITSSLSEQLGTTVSIGEVRLRFFKSAEINQVFIEDQQQDTLVYINQLTASVDNFSLLDQKISFDNISIIDIDVNLSRSVQDSLFNFQFLIDNFTSPADTTVVQTSGSPPWEIGFDLISIENLSFSFRDSLEALYVISQLDQFSIDVEQFNPQAQILNLISFEITNPDVQVRMNSTSANTVTSAPANLEFPFTGWNINADQAMIESGKVIYNILGQNDRPGQFDPQNLHISNLTLNLHNFQWDSTRLEGRLNQLKLEEHSGLKVNDLQASFELGKEYITIKDFSVETPSSKISNTTNITFSTWNNLNDFLNEASLNTQFGQSSVSLADLERFNIFIPDSFRIKQPLSIQGAIALKDQRINFNQLNLSAGKLLNINISGVFNPLTFKHNINLQSVGLNYKKVRISLPVLQLPSMADDLGVITLSGQFQGDKNVSIIKKLYLKTSSSSLLSASGTVRNFLTPSSLNYDLQIDRLTTTANDLALFSTTPLPSGLYEMQEIAYNGLLAGDVNTFNTKGKLSTAIGILNTDILLDFNESYSDAEYSGNFSLEKFDLGTFASDTLLGKASLQATLEGRGLQPDSLDITLNATVEHFFFNDYNYQNINIDGAIDRMQYTGKAGMNDPNLTFDFDGKVDLNESVPGFQFRLQLDTLDLAALNFSTDSTRLSASIQSNFRGNNADDFLGNASIRQLNLSNYEKHFHIDSLLINAALQDETNKVLKINSDLIKASFEGKYNLTDLPAIFVNYVNDFFPVDQLLPSEDKPEDLALEPFSQSDLPDQNLTFSIFIDDLPRLTKLFTPVLESMDTLSFKGRFDTQQKSISSNLYIPDLKASGWEADSLVWRLAGDVRELNSKLYVSHLTQGTMDFRKNLVTTKLSDNTVQAGFKIYNGDLDPIFDWGALLRAPDENYLLTFDDTLKVNNEIWGVAPAHEIKFRSDFLFIRDFILNKGNQELSINTYDKPTDAGYTPIALGFKNVDLREFSDFTNIEGFDFAGLLNGKVTLNDMTENPHYTADLNFNEIIINDTLIGDLNILAQQKSTNPIIDLQASLSGNGNNLQLNGTYNIESQNIRADLNIQQAPFILLDPFTAGALRNSSGFLSGQLSIRGNPGAPAVNGQLNFKKATTTITYLNTRYSIPEHSIQITDKGIDFGQLSLTDAKQNKAILKGSINYENFKNIQLNLGFDTKRFRFLNTSVGDNELFYGTLYLSALVDVTGPIEEPRININAGTLSGSKLFVNSITEEQISGQADYIIYGTPGEIALDSLLKQRASAQNIGQKFDLRLNLELTPEAELIVLVDPASGDQLSSRGNANLTIKVPPSGEIDIRGVYTAQSGEYQFNYQNLVRRAFQLDKGSRLNFVGDPLDTRFNITATYKTRTSVYPLISNESNLSDAAIAQAKERTDVKVLMKMVGDLSQPVITFDIQIPAASNLNINSSVDNKISQLKSDESELNKQVFGLLLLNSFVAEQSATASLSTAGENIALSSVSNLISNQLNRLSDRYLDGLGLTFDLESYRNQFEDNTSTRTNLNVGLSQSLFNDRLTVKVGGVVQLNNNSAVTEDSGFSNIAGDFVLEYQLDKSGNYILRVFQKSDYDAFNDSNTYKTGVGINFKKSFGQ